MTTRKIKIVKRDAPVAKPIPAPKNKTNPERSMTHTVKGWINERRKNTRDGSGSLDRPSRW